MCLNDTLEIEITDFIDDDHPATKTPKLEDHYDSDVTDSEEPRLSIRSIKEDGVVSSPVCAETHNCYRFGTLQLADFYSLLSDNHVLADSSINPSAVVPWHVSKGCMIIVDLQKLKSMDDLTYDSWWWKHLGAYSVIAKDEDDEFRKPHSGEDITTMVRYTSF